MLLQALRVEIEMKNLNLQVTFLVQKSVGTRSHTEKRCGNAFPTRSHHTTLLIIEICFERHSDTILMKGTKSHLPSKF